VMAMMAMMMTTTTTTMARCRRPTGEKKETKILAQRSFGTAVGGVCNVKVQSDRVSFIFCCSERRPRPRI
jgi:hypothetical protein